jgi:RNA polymerase sigma factor (sigma-70 family)
MSAGLVPALIRRLRRDPAADPPADAELVRRFAALRDEAAFEELLRRHGPLVWGVCRRRLHNRADAEDAFQSTFLVLARRAGAIRRPEALGCWLYGVAHRVAGRLRARTRSVAAGARLASPAAPALEAVAAREFLVALDEELLKLPDRLRGPLVLCFLQERTQDEAAKQLGVSLSTLKRRLDAGRKLLRVRLTRRGVDLSAALAAAGLAVPSAVADAVVRAAAGGLAAGIVSANVVTVTEGVVRAMGQTKLKAWAAGLLMATAAVGGTGYFATTGASQTGSPDGGAPTAPKGEKPAADRDRLTLELLKLDAEVAEIEAKKAEAELERRQRGLAESKQQAGPAAEKARQEAERKVDEARVKVFEARIALAAARQKLQAAQDRLAAGADLPELRKLREEKLKVARRGVEIETQYSGLGRSLGSTYAWSRRLLEAEREFDPSPANRVKAAREHLDRMKRAEDTFRRNAPAAATVEQVEATYYRVEAEIWLKEAEAARPPAPPRIPPADGGGAAAPPEVEKLRLELEQTKLEAAERKKQVERLEERLRDLMDRLEKERDDRGVPLDPFLGGRAVPVPEGFRGTVRQIEGTAKDLAAGKDVLVEFTPGTDAGLRQGAVLTVYRKQDKMGKYLGTLTVVSANAKDAVGRFTPANPRRVGPDDLPKAGDELMPNTR